MGSFSRAATINNNLKWAAKHTIKHMSESHHTGTLFPNIQKLPGFKPHLDAVRPEEIQCKSNETVYLYACVQFGIGTFYSSSERKLHFSSTHSERNCSSAIL